MTRTLKDLPIFAGDIGWKYIVAELTPSDGSAPITLVRAGNLETGRKHQYIFDKLEHQVRRIDATATLRCLGGGHCSFRDGTLWLVDRSHKFGSEPDRALTAKLVGEAHPGVRIEYNLFV